MEFSDAEPQLQFVIPPRGGFGLVRTPGVSTSQTYDPFYARNCTCRARRLDPKELAQNIIGKYLQDMEVYYNVGKERRTTRFFDDEEVVASHTWCIRIWTRRHLDPAPFDSDQFEEGISKIFKTMVEEKEMGNK
ncbi:uncharacterized protein FFNC_15359 [Fusarium fujikuroi]|nr:uncharacterized protein FFNC_15359 [Fusarium fujikuroi]